ncbi:GFA family protein [Devosia aurantiaca]|uniref:GFA family protein n=1 Tax=Devosia aurantiaca TaxID=2714858 RepID=A0A6M1SSR0_9HYPH|nr:GFA family protein [Devosia aurantiaca]NGP18255.1 GFA family protein [Devosia aurantiaca]
MSLTASCHCGAVKVELSAEPNNAHECNCSFCRRSGAIWSNYPREQITDGPTDQQAIYSANDGPNRHYFCAHCGMHVWGDSPDWSSAFNNDGTPKDGVDPNVVPDKRSYQVNLRMIDGLALDKIDIEQMDGLNNW